MHLPARLAMILAPLAVGAGLLAPAAASADVRFGPPLASEASTPGVGARTPAVAGNTAGVVAAAYAQDVGAITHVLARVKPASVAAFAAPQELSTVSSDAPAVAVASDGTVTAAWQQANACAGAKVFVATAAPGGPFGSAVKVSDNAFTPHLAVAPDGTVMVLYGRDKGSCSLEERVQVRPRAGSTVDAPISDAGFGAVDADGAGIGIDDNGTAIVAFTQALKVSPFSAVLRVARRPAGGAWTGITLPGPRSLGSVMGVAPDGHAVVAYNAHGAGGNANGNAVEAVSLAPGASTFGAPQALTNTGVNDPFSGLAVGNGGAAAVTTANDEVARRAPGAASFVSAQPLPLGASAKNLIPAYTARGELTLLDDEQLPGSSRFALVARPAPAGGPPGAAQPTGLDSDATGDAVAAPFGANDLVTGWLHRPAGGGEFQAGLALGDGTPPTVGPVSAPAGGIAGTALAFGATPSDDLGIAGVDWAFGDGTAASGAGVTHTFAAPGPSSWTATARDLVGNATSASGGLTIAAAPAPASAKLAVRIAKPRRGTRARRLRRLGGTASGPASRVEVSIVRVFEPKARSARARCAALGSSGRLAAKTRAAGRTGCAAGRFLKATGTRSWTLALRRRLPSGTYVVFARARSAAGAKSAVARATFTLRR